VPYEVGDQRAGEQLGDFRYLSDIHPEKSAAAPASPLYRKGIAPANRMPLNIGVGAETARMFRKMQVVEHANGGTTTGNLHDLASERAVSDRARQRA